jgi:hypothetical protein
MKNPLPQFYFPAQNNIEIFSDFALLRLNPVRV